jgi:hypothetical protein
LEEEVWYYKVMQAGGPGGVGELSSDSAWKQFSWQLAWKSVLCEEQLLHT